MKNLSYVIYSFVVLSSISADSTEVSQNIDSNSCLVQGRCAPKKNICTAKERDPRFELMGEFLYLQAKEDGLEYGISDSDILPETQLTGVYGRQHRIQPEFHPGYRVGLTYFLPHHKCELIAQWTCYHGTRQDSATKEPFGVAGLWPDWVDLGYSPVATTAHARWYLRMNILDTLIATSFQPAKILSLKPYAGFRAAWIQQKVDVNYEDIFYILLDNEEPNTPFLQGIHHSHYKGYGICAGLDARWKIWKGFSFVAKGDVALLGSHFNLHQRVIGPDEVLIDDIKDSIYMTLPVFDLKAGLAYERAWKNWGIGLYVGWEEQVWINQNMFNYFIDSLNSGVTRNCLGNLGLSGWNFQASVKF